jgi:hypothetical protein
LTAFLGPQTDRKTLIAFYRKVKPFGPGWKRIREEAGLTDAEITATHENIPVALVGWLSGCSLVWSSLFLVGSFLYGRRFLVLLLAGVAIVSGLVLLAVVRRLWSARGPTLETPKSDRPTPAAAVTASEP